MKKVNLNKIPIYPLLVMLNNLYEEGANFVDIQGEANEKNESDVITFMLKPEYYTEEAIEEEEEDDDDGNSKLTDDEINDII